MDRLEKTRIACRTPEFRDKMRKIGVVRQRILWQNPEYREMQTYKLKLSKQTDSFKINQSIAQKKRDLIGEKNPMWRGGISSYSHIRIRDYKWKNLRARVFERDKNTCQRCGDKSKVRCHHIIPFILTQDDSEINLQSLCLKCHRIADYQFQYIL